MKLKHALTTFTIAAFAAIFLTGIASADKCPYCGDEYGEGAPGDEAYIASIRAQHEAECSMRPSSGRRDTGAGYEKYRQVQEEERERAEEEAKRIEAEQEMARRKHKQMVRQKEERGARREEENRAKSEWEKKKRELKSIS